MDIAEINSQFPAIFDVFFFCVGACVGSFLNVCIYRIPKGESIMRPPSHCACGKPIKWFDNIPIAGWFLLGGKARCCGRRISFRYPFVELLTALVFLALWAMNTPYVAFAGMMFSFIMIFCTFVDIDNMMLPDFATIGGTVAGFLISLMMPQIHGAVIPDAPFAASVIASGIKSALGIVVGTGILYWIRILGECVFKKEAMGEGDVLLIGCIGAFCGWQGAMFAIFGGSIIGALTMIPIVATKRLVLKKRGKKARADLDPENDPLAIPFGPWLAFGGMFYFMFVKDLIDMYFAGVSNAFFGI